MSRYNIDKERLRKLSGMTRRDLSSKQMKELTVLKAMEEASVLEMDPDKLIRTRDYLNEQSRLGRATMADLARLEIINERISRL